MYTRREFVSSKKFGRSWNGPATAAYLKPAVAHCSFQPTSSVNTLDIGLSLICETPCGAPTSRRGFLATTTEPSTTKGSRHEHGVKGSSAGCSRVICEPMGAARCGSDLHDHDRQPAIRVDLVRAPDRAEAGLVGGRHPGRLLDLRRAGDLAHPV